ncbi:MAG TPA: hypothetical protein VLX09_13410 [Stellaceae bacterium]|nr:hypothetical protein [Stellaceae bacterium]
MVGHFIRWASLAILLTLATGAWAQSVTPLQPTSKPTDCGLVKQTVGAIKNKIAIGTWTTTEHKDGSTTYTQGGFGYGEEHASYTVLKDGTIIVRYITAHFGYTIIYATNGDVSKRVHDRDADDGRSTTTIWHRDGTVTITREVTTATGADKGTKTTTTTTINKDGSTNTTETTEKPDGTKTTETGSTPAPGGPTPAKPEGCGGPPKAAAGAEQPAPTASAPSPTSPPAPAPTPTPAPAPPPAPPAVTPLQPASKPTDRGVVKQTIGAIKNKIATGTWTITEHKDGSTTYDQGVHGPRRGEESATYTVLKDGTIQVYYRFSKLLFIFITYATNGDVSKNEQFDIGDSKTTTWHPDGTVTVTVTRYNGTTTTTTINKDGSTNTTQTTKKPDGTETTETGSTPAPVNPPGGTTPEAPKAATGPAQPPPATPTPAPSPTPAPPPSGSGQTGVSFSDPFTFFTAAQLDLDYANFSPSVGANGNQWGGGGSAILGLAPNFGLQLDGGYHNISSTGPHTDDWTAGVTGLWMIPDTGLRVGPSFGYQRNNTGTFGTDTKMYGGFADFSSYFYETAHPPRALENSLQWEVNAKFGGLHSSNEVSGFYGGGGGNLYPIPNLRLYGDFDYTKTSTPFASAHENDYSFGGEYLFPAVPISVYGGFTRSAFEPGTFHVNAVMVGFKFYWNGNGAQTLVDRQSTGTLPFSPISTAIGFKF